jgi:inosine-uridine nucleoside N-ribohydrolase
MSRLPVWLDCDPGHDDAIALIAASQLCKLIGVSTVAGNATLARTTDNALALCDAFGLSVPVHAGADRPWVAPVRHAHDIHGESGLFGVTLPSPLCGVQAPLAAQAILDASHRVPGLWLVAVGPLTNVALALALDPTLAQRLAGISIMGGGVGLGNATPMAEFNFLVDPEAAQRVLQSGARLLIAGLDLTHQFCFGQADACAIRAACAGRSPAAQSRASVVADIYAHFAERYFEVTGMPDGPMHDPCAVLALTHPELFERQALHCEVELAGGTRGMLVADLRFPKLSAAPNAEVLRRIDAQAARRVLADAVLGAVGE